MNIHLSIIVPVYNVEKYLKKCIDSILGQTFIEFELILVDDGSTDASGAICDEYAKIDRRIRVFHQMNQGVSVARNVGLNAAQGTYIGFVDADDWIETDMYEKLLFYVQKHSAQIAICKACIEYNKKQIYINESKVIVSSMNNMEASKAILKGSPFGGSLCDKLFHRSLFCDIRLDKDIFIGEDILYLLDLVYRSELIIYIPLCKYHHVQRQDSATKFGMINKKSFSNHIIAHEKICEKINFYYFELNKIAYFAYLRAHLSMGYLVCMRQDSDKTFYLFLKKKIRANIIVILSNEFFNKKEKIIAISLCIPLWISMFLFKCLFYNIKHFKNEEV